MKTRFKDRLRRGVLSFMLCWMLVLGMSVSFSPPAYSLGVPTIDFGNIAAKIAVLGEELVAMAKEYAFLGEIIDVCIAIGGFLGTAFNDTSEQIRTVAKSLTFADSLLTRAEIQQTDYLNSVHVTAVATKEKMKYAAEHASPGSGHACRALLLHQVATTTEEFEEGIVTMILSAMRTMYRGGQPGNNTKFASDMMDQRCVNKFGSPVDGYPAQCVDTATQVGPFKRTFVDADISPFMLDGAITLEVPPVETYTDTLANGQSFSYMMLRPEDKKPEQKAFVAAFNFCMNLVGPRPSPPWGKTLFTSQGMIDYDIFAQGLAIETGMDTQCARLLAFYTRPNEKQQAPLRKMQNDRCEAARKSPSNGPDKIGILNDEVLLNKFGNCKQGLSAYQAQFLSHIVCKSLDHYTELYKASALTTALLKETTMCTNSWNAWQKNLAAMQGTLVDAVAGQMGVKMIWKNMSSSKNSGYAGTNMNLYSYVFDQMLDAPDSKIRTVSVPKEEETGPVLGVPVSADEIDLPRVASP